MLLLAQLIDCALWHGASVREHFCAFPTPPPAIFGSQGARSALGPRAHHLIPRPLRTADSKGNTLLLRWRWAAVAAQRVCSRSSNEHSE